ncbi:thioesterase family protein [Smaragdicoccus niigatensis]|uniref:thioesterase family protein n=1 Tax=Smaragdicoccus niigatensis TaxID=359359 RepID=UPI00035D7E88|nr:thioesterase family protein [Smaragdicoccus niigatensis]
MALNPGLSARFDVEITPEDTALQLGSGDVEVLGTPRLVALAERATVMAVALDLPMGSTTVGTDVAIRHRKATLPGSTISVTAELVGVEGSKLTFDVSAHENGTLIASGQISRAVVDRKEFVARISG